LSLLAGRGQIKISCEIIRRQPPVGVPDGYGRDDAMELKSFSMGISYMVL
jgi:hypothetical protein